MAVDTTLLLREVQRIIDEGQGVTHYRLGINIKAGPAWGVPTRIDLYSIERDYETRYGDVVVIEVIIGLGTYAYRLMPYRDQLFVDVTSVPVYENGAAIRSDRPSRVKRYRAVLLNKENPGLVGRTPQASSEEDLNQQTPVTVELQLIDEGLYQSRLITVGRLYRQMAPMTVLQSILTETTALVDTKNQPAVTGVSVTPGFNKEVRTQLVIPHGTPLFDVPSLLQKKEGGCYPTGIGCYLQRGQWYVFPPYNTQRFKQPGRTLTVLSVPPNRYYGGERTYRLTDTQVIIVCAGNMETQDDGHADQLNQGNAVRVTNNRNLLVYGEANNNKTQVSRQDNVFEFEGPTLRSGFTNAQWAKEGATSNPLPHYSEMAHRNGRYVMVEWLHGDSSLLTPGMPVKFMTATQDKLNVVYGTLLGVHEQRIPAQSGMVATHFPASIRLKLFLSREEGV